MSTKTWETPEDDFERLAVKWPELEINNSHGGRYLEIFCTVYGGIWSFAAISDEEFGECTFEDRLWETPGQALDDALDFIQEIIIGPLPEGDWK